MPEEPIPTSTVVELYNFCVTIARSPGQPDEEVLAHVHVLAPTPHDAMSEALILLAHYPPVPKLAGARCAVQLLLDLDESLDAAVAELLERGVPVTDARSAPLH